jgi:hypothetical protein
MTSIIAKGATMTWKNADGRLYFGENTRVYITFAGGRVSPVGYQTSEPWLWTVCYADMEVANFGYLERAKDFLEQLVADIKWFNNPLEPEPLSEAEALLEERGLS